MSDEKKAQLISFDRMNAGEFGIFRSEGIPFLCQKHETKPNVLIVWRQNSPRQTRENIIDEKRAKCTYIEVVR